MKQLNVKLKSLKKDRKLKKEQWLQAFVIGIALFSMFFGGGNLTFPLWCGIESGSMLPTTLGFLLSGVMLPFYGVIVCLAFKGNYDRLLSVFGKPFGQLVIFLLLLFWIPLGSGPRCHQLAYGAFTQIGGTTPLWAYSALYSIVVYFLTYRKSRVLDILGYYITPTLLVSLIFFVWVGVDDYTTGGLTAGLTGWSAFKESFLAGYYTMDFIAAIFFTSTIISLIRSRGKTQSYVSFAASICMIALLMLSFVYIGMVFVGNVNTAILAGVPRDQLLAALGQAMFKQEYHFIIFSVITLSCLTTSVALSLVFSDYLRTSLFKERISHRQSLAIAVFTSFLFSMIGFEPLAVLISYAMSTLYPLLLVMTTVAMARRTSTCMMTT